MSPEDERFHYFKIVDLNGDFFVDGLEVWKVPYRTLRLKPIFPIQAVQHSHDSDGKDLGLKDDIEVEKNVDEIMKEMDLDGDGLINWFEYVKRDE